jgi:hypothetical protein
MGNGQPDPHTLVFAVTKASKILSVGDTRSAINHLNDEFLRSVGRYNL